MADSDSDFAADLAAFKRSLTDLPLKSLIKVQEAITREFQVRAEAGQIQEASPAPWRRSSSSTGDKVPAGKGKRSKPY